MVGGEAWSGNAGASVSIPGCGGVSKTLRWRCRGQSGSVLTVLQLIQFVTGYRVAGTSTRPMNLAPAIEAGNARSSNVGLR